SPAEHVQTDAHVLRSDQPDHMVHLLRPFVRSWDDRGSVRWIDVRDEHCGGVIVRLLIETIDEVPIVRLVGRALERRTILHHRVDPRNPRTGELLYPGLERGGEHGAIADDSFSQLLGSWLPLTRGEGLDPNSFGIPFLGTLFFQQMVFNDLNWDYRTLDYDADVAFADATIGPIINSTDPDLSNFKSLGGKL